VDILTPNVDVDLLRNQRNYLLDLVGSKALPDLSELSDNWDGLFGEDVLEGLIHLLDSMLDVAEEN